MKISFPRTVGAIAGWSMLAFVVGVGTYSLTHVPHLAALPWCVLILSCLSFLFAPAPWRMKAVCAIVLGFVLGLCRADIATPPKFRWINGRAVIIAVHTTDPAKMTILERWRHAMTMRIASALPRDEAALITGILYGDGALSTEQRALFRSAGLTHLVAVSGSNVTVVVQFVSLMVLQLKLRRRHAFLITSIALFAFVGFVGFSASVLRAALMGWFVLLAREIGRLSSPTRLLLVSATLLLLVNPWQLMFDAGFALSFLAMWGLLAWAPLFELWLARIPSRFALRETLSMTLAATLMTAPYLAWSFQRMTLIGPLTNVLALPLVPFVMLWGMLVAVWGMGPGSIAVRLPATGLARLIEGIAGLSKFFPWLDFSVIDMNLSTLGATYALIIYLWFMLSGKNKLSTTRRHVSKKISVNSTIVESIEHEA